MTVLARSRLTLTPSALALRELGAWLEAALDRAPDPTAVVAVLTRAELATHEACMNVVDHGQLPEGELIELSLVLTDDRLTVQILDRGREFCLADVPTPPIDVLQERGYGVKIIRSLVSGLSYRRIDHANVLELTIDIPPTPDPKGAP